MKAIRIIRYILLYCLFLSGIYSNAQEILDRYLVEAAENNPGLKAQFSEYMAALERVPQVGALPDPTIAFGYFIQPIETRLGPQQAKISAPVEQPLIFDSFVIPFKEHDKFAYIALSISFDFTNSKLREEMTENKDYLRGIIYDILEKEINRANKVPPTEELKAFIVQGVNNLLSAGAVSEAYIINFLAV